ncbi:hypothetical protein MKX62_21540 [Sporosarcina sp. FSL K6-5500]
MDKYVLTGRVKELMMIVMDPELSMPNIPEDVLEEILNPPTDDDGYVHQFYLKEETKFFIELLTGKED